MCQCLSNIIDWGSGERSSLAWFPAQEKPLTPGGRRGGAEPDFSGGTSLFCLVEVSPKGSAVAAVDEKTLDMIIGCFSSTGNIQLPLKDGAGGNWASNSDQGEPWTIEIKVSDESSILDV